MNCIELYFKWKEKILKKNQSQHNLGIVKLLKEEQKKDTKRNNSIESNKDSYIHIQDEKKKNND